MGRLLFAIVLFGLLALFVRLWLKASKDREKAKQDEAASTPTLQCAHCHVFFPTKDAVRMADKAYCCLDHASLANPKP